MMKNKHKKSHHVLHPSDQGRIIENYSGVNEKTTFGGFLVTTFFFVVSTWAIIYLMFDKIYPFVTGDVNLINVPYYVGLLGVWVLYTVTYSYFFMKKAHVFTIGKFSSVGAGLIIQAFVYLVMAFGIAMKEYRSTDSSSFLSLTNLRIPLVDNPVNVLLFTGFLFGLGFFISFINMGIKSKSKLEASDRLMFVIAAASIYTFTLIHNFIAYGWIPEIFLTSAMFTSIIMIGITPYVYSGAIYCGSKSSKVLNKKHYGALFGITFFVLLVASYRITADLFIVAHEHNSIDFFNPSLIFVFAILSTVFTRVLTYPRLISEYNNDVMQTKRINDSNKGLQEDNDYIPMDDEDQVDPIGDDGHENSDYYNENDQDFNHKNSKNKKKSSLYEADHSTFDDTENMDGIFDEDEYEEEDLFESYKH